MLDTDIYEYDEFSNLFLKIPNITKVDILEYFEYLILGYSFHSTLIDSNDIIPEFLFIILSFLQKSKLYKRR